MQTLWIDGQPQQFTPRGEIRLALRAGYSMRQVDTQRRQALMSAEAFRRFERLWAVSTATEHPYTRAWGLERWSARRARIRDAVSALREG